MFFFTLFMNAKKYTTLGLPGQALHRHSRGQRPGGGPPVLPQVPLGPQLHLLGGGGGGALQRGGHGRAVFRRVVPRGGAICGRVAARGALVRRGN